MASSLGTLASADLVLSYEFDSSTGGFTAPATNVVDGTSGLSISNDLLIGVARTNDPQLILPSSALPGGVAPTTGFTWDTLQYRVREINDQGNGAVSFANAQDLTGLVFAFNGMTVNTSNTYSFSDAGGGFTDVTVDLSQFGAMTLTNFRLDPIGGATQPTAANNTFQVDFIRFNDTSPPTAVPEPTSLALLGVAGVGAAFQRRRKQRKLAS